jgi:small subunit ribosomal protein S1
MAVSDDSTQNNDQTRNDDQRDSEMESAGMEDLLRMYDEKMSEFSEGDIVRGRVLKIRPSEVVVDIGYKSEGLIPIQEVTDLEGNVEVRQGEELDVHIERLEDPSGYVLLSREKAKRLAVWDRIEETFREERPVTGRVIDRVKGGLSVDVGGIKAFLPGSLVDVKPIRNLDSLKGKELEFKIVSFDKKRNNIVLSRRAIVEVEYVEKKKQTLSQLEEGKVTHGAVKNITDYGVFVDLGGIDGLLHITDISWGRVNHPSEFFNVGDEIDVVVLKFDPDAERVSLGYKQRRPDPWLDVAERYPIGSKVSGKVVSVTDYGAFVELEEGVEGLIHISEMSWTRRVRPSKVVNAGDQVEAIVSDVNVANRRISLSLKALESNPWDTISERYPVGAVVTGRVRNLTDFGAFVEVEEGIDGLIHISDMSWSRRLKHPSEVLKKGDSVEARVINVDGEHQRLSLSIKEFVPNEWDEYARGVQTGEVVTGTISKITDFGLFIRLADGVEGLAHISEVDREGKDKLESVFRPGEQVRARIIKVDWTDKKIGLSLRDVPQEFEAEDVEQSEVPQSPAGDRTAGEPATEEPGTGEPGTGEPGTEEPGTEEPGIEEPGIEEPGIEEPGIEEPGIEEPGSEEPGIEEPGIEEPGIEEPGIEEPGIEEPGIEEPGIEEPGIEEPGIEKPGTEKPGTEE